MVKIAVFMAWKGAGANDYNIVEIYILIRFANNIYKKILEMLKKRIDNWLRPSILASIILFFC